MILRPTLVLKFDECPRAVKYQLEGWTAAEESANLVFGSAVHSACTTWLIKETQGMSFDPVRSFERAWLNALETKAIAFNSQMGPDDLLATGRKLCEMFPEAWRKLGMVPAITEQGVILVEHRLQAPLGEEVILSTQPDIVAFNQKGVLVSIDIKTPAAASGPHFPKVAEQLTAHQLVIDANGEKLDLPPVGEVGFLELIKRKVPAAGKKGKGPEIAPLKCVPARSPEVVNEYRQKVLQTARDIRAGKFPRRPRMAHNSPCDMCEFRVHCIDGETTGLVAPDRQEGRVARAIPF